MAIASPYFANAAPNTFENGYLDIPWKSSVVHAKSILKEMRVEFNVTTYSSNNIAISFSNGNMETTLRFYKDMFSSFNRKYSFSGPKYTNPDYWKQIFDPITQSVSIDDEEMIVRFLDPEISVSNENDPAERQTTVYLSMVVFPCEMSQMQGDDRKKLQKEKEKRDSEKAMAVVSKLIELDSDPKSEQ